ncbi:MAG: transposase [Janthinobacterium lividum]
MTLDIDDTCDIVHGRRQLSTPTTTSAASCPIHVYDTKHSRPVAVVLRPGQTPSGFEVRAHVRRHIHARWPRSRILFWGDGHYTRPEAVAWCEANGLQYVFGMSGSKPLSRKVEDIADASAPIVSSATSP